MKSKGECFGLRKECSHTKHAIPCVAQLQGRRGYRVGWYMGLLLALALPGCAAIVRVPGPRDEFMKQHYIVAHEDGYTISTEKRMLMSTKLSVGEATHDIEDRIFTAGVDRHARKLRPGEQLQIMVFVHGGLNGYGDDFDRMREMLARPEDCPESGQRPIPTRLFVSARCDNALTRYYPIFINWNSELWDSIRDDLFFIRFGRRHPEIGWFTWPFVLGGRVAAAVFGAPNGVVAQIWNFWNMKPEGAEWAEGVLFPVRAVTTPAVKAFGTSAWQIMERRANLLVTRQLEGGREGAAWNFLQAINKRIEMSGDSGRWKMPDGMEVPVEVTLVGHSMGAIVLNRLISESTESDYSPITRIVYLAPAASIEEVEMTVRPFLRVNPKSRFWAFNLHQKDEARELHWLPPRGTLLVWIDSFFEPFNELADARYGRTQGLRVYGYREDWQDFEQNRSTEEKGINMCEWKEKEGRPTQHGKIADPEYLEKMLWVVDHTVFKENLPGPRTPMACMHVDPRIQRTDPLR